MMSSNTYKKTALWRFFCICNLVQCLVVMLWASAHDMTSLAIQRQLVRFSDPPTLRGFGNVLLHATSPMNFFFDNPR